VQIRVFENRERSEITDGVCFDSYKRAQQADDGGHHRPRDSEVGTALSNGENYGSQGEESVAFSVRSVKVAVLGEPFWRPFFSATAAALAPLVT
jgi:hypothetical protein